MRETFATSRELEFFSESELCAQIGYPSSQWAIALLKELIDNSLDACEVADISPCLKIDVKQDSFTVADNGPGLPEKVLIASLDYTVRVSDKQNYISPSRGQQGNALKTLWAAPLVLDGEKGSVTVATPDYGYRVELKIDHIAQAIQKEITPISERTEQGTAIAVHSEKMAAQLKLTDSHYNLLICFAIFNPHARFYCQETEFQAVTSKNFKKWTPNLPTSPHWYDLDSLEKLTAGFLANARERRSPITVREFIRQFDGLKRTDKQKVIGEAMAPDSTLEHLTDGNGLNRTKINKLLSLMKEHSTPIKPGKLGSLGKDFLFNFLTGLDCKMEGFKYKKIELDTTSAPCIVETAIAHHSSQKCLTFWGLNFTPIPKDLPWKISHYLQDDNILIDDDDPVVLVIHITQPKFAFTDRGKSSIALTIDAIGAVKECLEFVAKDWAREKRKKKRSEKLALKEFSQIIKNKDVKIKIKYAAYEVMEKAYLQASDNNRLPANARQIMYQARPLILELTHGKIWKKDSYFTQKLLPDFIWENPQTTSNWDVLYDSSGHFVEPHTKRNVPLGTLGVREYIRDWRVNLDDNLNGKCSLFLDNSIETSGHKLRYKFCLFIEKEGFNHVLESARISQRYDIAIFSTKGMSNTSARTLVENLSKNGVTILVAHDFDKAGLTIARTLGESNRRYQFDETPRIVDIGLRLPDVEAMGLSSEPVAYGKSDPRRELIKCGCSQAEIDFLCSHHYPFSGDRVELNAMTSAEFISWLENKFSEHGVTKFVPDEQALVKSYRLQVKRRKFNAFIRNNVENTINEEIKRIESTDIPIPDKLAIALADALKRLPTIPWELAVDELAEQFESEEKDNLAC